MSRHTSVSYRFSGANISRQREATAPNNAQGLRLYNRANHIPFTYLPDGCHMAATWLPLGCHLAATFRKLGMMKIELLHIGPIACFCHINV